VLDRHRVDGICQRAFQEKSDKITGYP